MQPLLIGFGRESQGVSHDLCPLTRCASPVFSWISVSDFKKRAHVWQRNFQIIKKKKIAPDNYED